MTLRRLLGWTLLLLLLGCLALLAVPFTAVGSRVLVEILDGVTDMEIVYGGGSLLGEFSLRRFVYRSDDGEVEVVLRSPRARLELDCLWRSEICLDYIEAEELEIIVHPGEGEPDSLLPELDVPSPLWPLPFHVGSDRVRLEELYIHWRGGEIRSGVISGAAELFGETVRVDQVTAQDSVLLIYEERLDLDLQEAIEMPEVDLPIELLVDRGLLLNPSWNIDGFEQQLDRVEVAGHWRGRLMQLQQGRLQSSQWGSAQLAGSLRYRHPYTVNAVVALDLQGFAFWPELNGSQGELQLQGPLDELAIDGKLCGTLPLRIAGRADVVSPEKPVALQLQGGCAGSGRPLELTELPGLADGPAIQMDGDWRLALSGDSGQQNFDLQATATGLGYERMPLSLQASHSEQRLDIEALELGNSRQGLARMSGQLALGEQLVMRAGVSLSDFELPDLGEAAALSGHISGDFDLAAKIQGSNWTVAMTEVMLEGRINDLPARLRGEVNLDQDLDPSGSLANLVLNGAEFALDARSVPDPRLKVQVDELRRWADQASGSLQLDVLWRRDQQELDLGGAISGAGWGPLQSRSLEFSGTHSLSGQRASAVKLHSGEAQLGDVQLVSVDLDLRGDLRQQQLNMQINGEYTTTIEVAGTLRDGDWRGVLQPTTLVVEAGVWQLDEAVDIDYLEQSARLVVADHCWQESATDLCLQGVLLGESGSAGLTLRGQLESLSDFLPANYSLEGPLAGEMQASWESLQPLRLDLELRGDGGYLRQQLEGEESAELRWERFQLSYHGTPEDGQLQALIRRRGRDLLHMELVLPASRDGRLDGRLTLADFELQQIQPFFTSISQLQGLVSGELAIGGVVDAPEFLGELSLDRGRLALLGNPTVAEVPDLDLVFRGRDARLSGHLQIGKGSSSVQGQMSWQSGLAADIRLAGDAKELLYPPHTVVAVQEDLEIHLGSEALRIAGRVDIPWAEVVLEQLPEEGVPLSNDVILVDYTGNPLETSPLLATEIDLKIAIADRAAVSSDLFNARLGGDLQLRQQPGKPLQLFGNLRFVDGRIEALGQRLELIRGNLAFVGVPGNPQIDAQAERLITEDQVTVGVRVLGNLDQPKLEFYSRPALPDVEIMAYLLGGRRVDRVGDSNSLALALAMTSSLAQSQGLLKGVQLGVEGSDQNTRAAIGGYISDRIFLSYGVGLYQPVNTVTVRLDILRHLWMEVVSGLHNSADLYYSWETR